MYSQYLNEQFQLESQQEKYTQNQKQKTESIPSKQNKPQPQKQNKIELPKISSMTIEPNAQANNITSNRQKKTISQIQNTNARYLPKEDSNQKSSSLNKRDTQYLKRDYQLAESTKLPINSKVRSKDATEAFGNNVDAGQFMDGKERTTNYRSLSTHLMNKNKKNALRILSRGEQDKFNQQFYHSKEELLQLSIEQITLLSKRLKENIKTLDNTLSQKVAKALRQYKQGTSQPQSPEKQYILLKQTVSNNQSVLQNLSFDYLKLQSKQGQLQEQYYELQLAKEVTKTMQKIREIKRDIIQMKKRVRASSFQLNDSDILPKMTKKLNALKIDLFKMKQEADKNEVKMQQFQAKKGEIEDKSYRLSQKQSSLIEQAKNKKIRLEPDLFHRRSLQLKMRIDKSKQLKTNSENHIQRTTISLMNQINHLTNEIRQYQQDTKGLQIKISQIQKKAFNFIENNKSLLKNIAVSPQNSINYFQRKWVLQEQQSKIIKPILGIKSIKQQQKRQKNQLKQISQSTQQQHTQKAEKIQTPQSDQENQFMNLTESKIKQFNPISKDINLISLPSFQESRQQNETQTAITTLSRKQKSKPSPKNIQNQSIQTQQITFPKRFRLKKQKIGTGTSEQMIGRQEIKK